MGVYRYYIGVAERWSLSKQFLLHVHDHIKKQAEPELTKRQLAWFSLGKSPTIYYIRGMKNIDDTDKTTKV